MERILKMKKRLSPLPVELSFSNSKLYIGIPTRDSFFEFRGKTAELEDVMRIYEEIWSFASIIDDLNLTRRIWTKE